MPHAALGMDSPIDPVAIDTSPEEHACGAISTGPFRCQPLLFPVRAGYMLPASIPACNPKAEARSRRNLSLICSRDGILTKLRLVERRRTTAPGLADVCRASAAAPRRRPPVHADGRPRLQHGGRGRGHPAGPDCRLAGGRFCGCDGGGECRQGHRRELKQPCGTPDDATGVRSCLGRSDSHVRQPSPEMGIPPADDRAFDQERRFRRAGPRAPWRGPGRGGGADVRARRHGDQDGGREPVERRGAVLAQRAEPGDPGAVDPVALAPVAAPGTCRPDGDARRGGGGRRCSVITTRSRRCRSPRRCC